MAASTEQKVDFLLKKIGYTATKTGIAEDSSLSGTKKAPFAESVPSPLVTPSTNIWADSTYISATPPGSDTSYVKVYLSGSSGLRMTADSTVSGSRSFIAYTTYNNTSSARLTDWIDTQFGADYIIKVYKGDPNSGGTQLSAAGAGSNDTWFFDYSAGILNFNGTQIPSGVTDTNIYIVGYRYIGTKGAQQPAGISTFSTLYVSGISTFTGSIDANGDLDVDGLTELDHVNVSAASTFGGLIDVNAGLQANTLKVEDLINNRVVIVGPGGEIEDSANFTFDGSNLNIVGHVETDTLQVSGVTTTGGLLDINAGGQANTFKVEDLTDNRIVIAGTGGELEDSANLTFNGTTLAVTGNATVSGNVDLGDATSDTITATGRFDSDLVPSTDGARDLGASGNEWRDLWVTGTAQIDDLRAESAKIIDVADTQVLFCNSGSGDVAGNAALTWNGSLLNVTGAASFSGNVTIGGTLTYEDVTNIDSVGIVTARTGIKVLANGIDVDAGGLDVTGISTIAQLKMGSVTANAILDEDNMASNSATALPTQQSVKAYVDTTITAQDLDFQADTGGALNIDLDSETLSVVGTANEIETAGSGNQIQIGLPNDVIVGAALTVTSALKIGASATVGITTILDEDNMASNSAAALATQQSIKAYVDTQVTAQDLDVAGDSGTGAVDLDSQSLTLAGTSNEIETSASGQTITIGLPNNVTISNQLTVTGAIDANGDLDVDGLTELDHVNVSAASTFAGLVDINAGGQANTFKVEDLTNTRIVIAGTGGELEDSANLTFNGSLLNVTGGVQVSGTLDANGDLDVDGHTELDILNVSGVSTFAGLVDINAGGQANTFKVEDLTDNRVVIAGTGGELEDSANFTFDGSNLNIVGHVETDTLNVSGISTLAQLKMGSVTATAILDEDNMASNSATSLPTQQSVKAYVDTQVTAQDLDVAGDSGTGAVDLDSQSLTVAGTSNEVVTSASGQTITVGLPDNVTVAGDFTVGSGLTVVGVSTFAGNIDANANIDVAGTLDVDGDTELDNVNVSGISTFVGVATFTDSNVYIQQELWVGGLQITGGGPVVGNDINARHIKATGISTFQGDTTIGVGGTTLTADVSISRVGINSTAPAYTLDVGGIINSSTDVRINGVSVSGGASVDDVTALAIALG